MGIGAIRIRLSTYVQKPFPEFMTLHGIAGGKFFMDAGFLQPPLLQHGVADFGRSVGIEPSHDPDVPKRRCPRSAYADSVSLLDSFRRVSQCRRVDFELNCERRTV